MDDTQRLQWDDDEEEIPVNRHRPVGNLHMFAGIHGPAQDFPIYLGQNLIGRHASCDITLPAQSVSKKHAILEVKADCHTICDNSSLNKTRRGKAALSPNVRYSLSDGDFLMFADVACRYTIAKKVEETTTLEDSEDDSVLVPGTQGPLAIENTPAVAIRRMVRGTVLARDSGDEDEDSDVQRKFSGEGEGFGSVKDSHKTSGPGAIFSPITDTIVPESDEENDTSTSESHFPSLNLRCDSDTDTHETSTRRSSFTPSSLSVLTPPSLKEQAKDVPLVDKEEKKAEVRTDGENKLTLLTEDTSGIKDDQEGEQKAKSMLDDSLSGDDGGHVQALVVSVTLDANLKEATNEREETLKENTMNKQTPEMMSTGNPCVQEDEDSRRDMVQKDEINIGNNATVEENNIKLMDTDLKTEVEADFYLDTDTDVDEEDATSSPSGVKKIETVEIKTDGGQKQIVDRTLGTSGTVLDIKEDDAASSGADLETVTTHQINIDSDTDDEADNATHADQKKSDRTEVKLGSDTDGEDDLKMVKSTSENADMNRRKEEHNRTLMTTETNRSDSDSDTDVENTADIAKPDEKKTMQDSRCTSEEKNEGFHMDSDTDVEDDVSNPEVRKDEWTTSITAKETKNKLHPDSDTDVDEDVGISSTVLTKDKQDSGTIRLDAQKAKDDFHLDSDTDVDEEDAIPGASDAVMENRPTSQIHIDDQQKVETAKSDSEKDETGVTNKEVSALHIDEDTDVDDDLAVLVLEETLAAEETAKSGREADATKEEAVAFNMDSDTDVDENNGPGRGLEEAEVAEGNMHSGGIGKEGGVEVLETGKALVSSGSETDALPQALKVEATNIPAKNSLEEEETQKTDSESTDYDLMATQCYLDPQEEESDLPDEEEATQAYIFSSTWAEPDPFKRPADPIGVLQISAVTLNASDEEIDDNAIAETQPYCSEGESHVGLRVQEIPELGNDSVYEQETTQPPDSVEGSETKLQEISCGTVSQEDTQPVSQYLATRAPQETGSWLHLKRDVPASVWVRNIQQDEASTDQKEEDDATKENEQASSMELEATQPYTLGIPASHTHTVQVHTPDVPAAEKDGISALPPTENKPSPPCSLEAPTTDELATLAHSVADDTQPCRPHVQTTGEDDTPDLNVVATGSDDTEPCSSVSVLTGEEDAKEISNKDKGKLSTRRGLSRSIKRQESVKKVQTAAEIVECPEEVLAVSDPHPEKLNECDGGVAKQTGNETELKGGRRRGAKRMGVVEVEDKIETKEEGVSTATRLRTNKRSSESEPSTSGINEKVKRKKLTGKSLVNVTKEELEDEWKEDSGLTTGERKDNSVPRNLSVNPAGMIESQICEGDRGDNVVKHMSEKCEDQPKENNSKTSAEISESEAPIVSDGNSTQTVSESNVDLPSKKRITTKRRAAAKLKKYTTEEAESRNNGDKMNDEHIDDHNSRVFQEQEVTHGKGFEKRTTQKSDVTAEPVEQKNDKGEDNRSSIKTRRAATKEEIPQVSTPVAVRKRGQGSKAEVEVKRRKSDESIEQEKVGEGKTGEDNTSSITGQTEEIQVGLADPSSGNEKSRRLRRNVKEEIKEESEKVKQAGKLTSRRSMSTRGGEKKMEEKESQGNSEDSPVSKTMPRRTRRFSKEETAKTEEVTDVVKTEADDTASKSSRTRKNVKEEKKTEVDIGNKEDAKMSETQTTRRAKRECRNEESVEKRETVKETVSRRTKKNSKEVVAQLEEDKSKISGRTRKGSKEELNTEQKGEETIAETSKEEPIGKKTTLRTRKNVKDDKKTGSEQADVDSKSERSSSRTRRKISMEDTEEVHGESKIKEVLGEGAKEKQEVELSAHEEKSRLSAGRSRRAATKEEIPLVSTPVAVRKRGQAAKAEVEVKRKKSDESIEQEEVVEVETPPTRRGRPRRLVAEAGSTETGNADGKEIHPPSPSPSRSSRQRPSSALSNPPEIRTPRRTNRTSTSAAATSPYVPHAGSAPKVLFTGVVDALGEGIIRTLGGDIADSVFDCTHLVTDRVRRTVKFLCALARGIPIVTLDWIDKCKKSGCFLSPTGFLVNDKEQEKSFNFVLSESLQKARRRPLFEGYEIHITTNVKPEPENMKDIIRCSGATFLPKMPRTFKEKSVVVSCPEDAVRCKSVPSSVPVTTAEFILSGILRQEVNPAAYLLNPAVEKTPAKRRR